MNTNKEKLSIKKQISKLTTLELKQELYLISNMFKSSIKGDTYLIIELICNEINNRLGFCELNLAAIKRLNKQKKESKRRIKKIIEEKSNTNKLTDAHIDKAIEKGDDLDNLYIYQKLTEAQIEKAFEKAIEKGECLDYLYKYQKLSEAQIDKAIERGKFLDVLYKYQF